MKIRHTASIGILKKLPTSVGKPGPPRYYTSCGILMHSSLVTTGEGLPLGLAAIKFWNRDNCHGANALKCRINPIRIILSWRIFWITMLNRTRPDAAPMEAFTDLDQYLLDELVPNTQSVSPSPSLGHYIVRLARLGGYLARAHDPSPGNTVIWRGLSRVTDIELGIMIGVQLVGN